MFEIRTVPEVFPDKSGSFLGQFRKSIRTKAELDKAFPDKSGSRFGQKRNLIKRFRTKAEVK